MLDLHKMDKKELLKELTEAFAKLHERAAPQRDDVYHTIKSFISNQKESLEIIRADLDALPDEDIEISLALNSVSTKLKVVIDLLDKLT